MKVIFLDVDGVICLDGQNMDQVAMSCLKEIVEKTQAKVVISSTWRLYHQHLSYLREELNKIGIDPLDVTEDLKGLNRRHDEISKWLADHPDVEKFAILDDWPDAEIKSRPETFFRTEGLEMGLVPEIAKDVVAYLEK